MDDFQSFANNEELIRQIQNNVPELKTDFLNLRYLCSQPVTDPNFNAAITSFYKIFRFVPLLAPHVDSYEMPFFRARPNDKKNVLFTLETDISYNSINTDRIKAGRFNQPLQAVFYSSLPVENSNINPSLVACLETCKGLTDPDYPVHLKDFTISRWKIKEPFYVINFCFDDAHLNANAALKKQTQEYIHNIRTCLNKESSDFILEFLTFFSEMSGRRSPTKNEYYILTAMFYAIQYYYKEALQREIHGLIYPSAMTEAKGLNLVITTDAVDRFLKPEKVMMYRFILVENTFHADPCSDMVNVENGRFTITGFRRIPDNAYYTVECENDRGPLRESKD